MCEFNIEDMIKDICRIEDGSKYIDTVRDKDAKGVYDNSSNHTEYENAMRIITAVRFAKNIYKLMGVDENTLPSDEKMSKMRQRIIRDDNDSYNDWSRHR